MSYLLGAIGILIVCAPILLFFFFAILTIRSFFTKKYHLLRNFLLSNLSIILALVALYIGQKLSTSEWSALTLAVLASIYLFLMLLVFLFYGIVCLVIYRKKKAIKTVLFVIVFPFILYGLIFGATLLIKANKKNVNIFEQYYSCPDGSRHGPGIPEEGVEKWCNNNGFAKNIDPSQPKGKSKPSTPVPVSECADLLDAECSDAINCEPIWGGPSSCYEVGGEVICTSDVSYDGCKEKEKIYLSLNVKVLKPMPTYMEKVPLFALYNENKDDAKLMVYLEHGFYERLVVYIEGYDFRWSTDIPDKENFFWQAGELHKIALNFEKGQVPTLSLDGARFALSGSSEDITQKKNLFIDADDFIILGKEDVEVSFYSTDWNDIEIIN